MNWQHTQEKSEDLADLDDSEIVKKTLENEENFLHIINRYKAKLFAYVRRISNLNEEDVDDVLQDVFIKVYQNLNDYDDSLKFSSWIYRITHNQVISNYRKLKARPQKSEFDLEDETIKNISSELDISKEIDNKILKENIKKVLAGIDIKYKEILVLKFLEEKSYNEISDIIKKPIGTVGSMMNKAKKEFRKELSRQNIKL